MGLAPSTQQAYLRAVRDLAADYKRSPDTLSTRDIHRYLLMLHGPVALKLRYHLISSIPLRHRDL